MKFKGTTLSINPSKYDMVIDSGYDSFSKNVKINVPEGWTAVVLQGGKSVLSKKESFALASYKYSKRDYFGVKFPLFGDVKAKIMFVRHLVNDLVVINDEKIKIGSSTYTLKANYSYKAEFKHIGKFIAFMDRLKLKPNEKGLIMTVADFSYVVRTVFPLYLKPGDAGTAYGFTSKNREYQLFVEDVFKNKLLEPIGWEGKYMTFSYFKVY